jgi:hypothetical protein
MNPEKSDAVMVAALMQVGLAACGGSGSRFRIVHGRAGGSGQSGGAQPLAEKWYNFATPSSQCAHYAH